MSLQRKIKSLFTFALSSTLSISAYASGSKPESGTLQKNQLFNRSSLADSVINYGRLYMHRPYRRGSGGTDTFDCSGFTSYVYRNFGYNLTHSSAAQANQFDAIRRDNLKKGDLVYFSGSKRSSQIGHVGIVTEVFTNGQFNFIHASYDHGITISNSNEPYYNSRYIKANRVIGGKQLAAVNMNVTEDMEEEDTFYPVQSQHSTQKVKKTIPAQYHTVKSGETLSEIADKYNLSVTDLKKLNGLKSSKLGLKQKIKVKEAETYTEIVEIKQPDTNASGSIDNQDNTHKVQKGESLLTISKTYGLNIEELKKLNNLTSSKIHTGQDLIVKKAEDQSNSSSNETDTPKNHKVLKGESLSSIAKAYNVSTEELIKSNTLSKKSIYPGLILNIPAAKTNETTAETVNTPVAPAQPEVAIKDIQNQTREEAKSVKVPEFKMEYNDKNSRAIQHKVHSGESLITISRDFKVPLDELLAMNNTQSTRVEVGQTVLIRVPIPPTTVKPVAKSSLPIMLGNINAEELKNPDVVENTTEAPATNSENSTTEPDNERSTQKYTVQRRETLSGIATKFGMTLEELRKLNNLKSNYISGGKEILVYGKSEETTENQTPVALTTPAQAKQDFYLVKKGDILGDIAKRFNLTTNDLKSMNNMNSSSLRVGQKLALNAETAQTVSPLTKTTKAQDETQEISYTVKKGDKLEAIALNYQMSVENLKQLNGLKSEKLKTGQKLKVTAGLSEATNEALTNTKKAVESKIESSSYKVKKGDNLESIARDHNMSIDDLKQLNKLKSEKLSLGQKLKVTGSGTELATITNKKVAESKPSTNGYTVKKGDNLESIAQEYNMSIDELKQLNKLKSDKLSLGQKLKVGGKVKAATEATETKIASNSYKVKKGDTPDAIAKKFNLTLDQLKELNDLKSNKIQVGQELTVSASNLSSKSNSTKTTGATGNKTSIHIIKKGESLYTIARDYNMTVDELKELNNTKDADIMPGQTLSVFGKSSNTKESTKSSKKQTTYTVRNGDSFYTIAKKFNCSTDELEKWNTISASKIKPGDKLIIKE